jgi:hypothetical protein
MVMKKKVYYFRCVACRSLIKEGHLNATGPDPGGFVHGKCPCMGENDDDEGWYFSVAWKFES